MFFTRATSGLPDQPRQGAGLRARIVRRCGELGAALCGAVTGRLRRRTAAPITPDSLSHPAPEQPDALLPQAPARRRRRYSRAADARLIDAVFPGLGPEARALLNTPAGECDPAMLEATLALLSEAIAQIMTPREGLQDAQDLFAAFRSSFAAILGEAPATAADAASDLPADAAGAPTEADPVAAPDPSAAAPDASGPVPLPQDPTQPPPTGPASPPQTAVVADSPPCVPPLAAPVVPPAWSDTVPDVPSPGMAERRGRVPHNARRARHRGHPRFATPRHGLSFRNRTMPPPPGAAFLPPPRLLFYAACTGPPAVSARTATGARVR